MSWKNTLILFAISSPISFTFNISSVDDLIILSIQLHYSTNFLSTAIYTLSIPIPYIILYNGLFLELFISSISFFVDNVLKPGKRTISLNFILYISVIDLIIFLS